MSFRNGSSDVIDVEFKVIKKTNSSSIFKNFLFGFFWLVLGAMIASKFEGDLGSTFHSFSKKWHAFFDQQANAEPSKDAVEPSKIQAANPLKKASSAPIADLPLPGSGHLESKRIPPSLKSSSKSDDAAIDVDLQPVQKVQEFSIEKESFKGLK